MNTTGKKFGGRQKGTPNKLNSKIKDKLSAIISDAISSLNLEDMTKAERLKLIQLGLPYIITKPQQEEIVRTAVANQNLDIDGEHLAPFPKQIITLPILQTSEIGDLVLDPFCGSGNVGKVCDVLERNFVGYDLNNYIS